MSRIYQKLIRKKNGKSKTEHSQDSELQPLVLRNDVWSPLGYDTKIDVFKFLRPYDIRKFCVYVNKSWASFCIDNKRYLPHPVSLRTVEQRFSFDEIQAYEQRIIDENKKRKNAERRERRLDYLFCLALLATWTCIVYLTVRINDQSEEDPTVDLLALCTFVVLTVIMTYCYQGCAE